jgi:5-methyltetrahydrofolate--homocysteine methyltransferase
MPAGAVRGSGAAVLDIVRWVREELGCNTICGASNVSFGLPDREAINANFLAMLIAGGMPSAITNPLKPELKTSILAADMLMGHDEDCLRWLKYQRQLAREQAAVAGGVAPASQDDRAARRAARREERTG